MSLRIRISPSLFALSSALLFSTILFGILTLDDLAGTPWSPCCIYTHLGWTLLSGLLVFLSGWWLATIFLRRFVRWLDSTLQRLQHVGTADVPVPPPVFSGELGALQETLTSLVRNIERRVKEQDQLERNALSEQQKYLLKAKDEADAASRAKSEFLSTMSHEIRTPLNSILGFAELVSQRLQKRTQKNPEDEETAKHLSIIRRNGQSLLAIINDILDLARIEAGRMPIEQMSFASRTLFLETVESFRFRAREKGIALELIAPDLPAEAYGDSRSLRQILFNLVGNAVKFTEQGHVRVTVSAEPEGFRIEVQDTGLGISAAVRPHLFTPFYQGDQSIRRKFGGTGLGMVIVKRLLDVHKGSITVESEEGRGTTIQIRFPCSFDRSGKVFSRPQSSVLQVNKKQRLDQVRILIVEDDPSSAFYLAETLQVQGAICRIVPDVDAMLKHCEEHVPDLIFLDMHMPGKNGFEGLHLLKADPKWVNIPTILQTADVLYGTQEKSQMAGFDGHLTKPFDVKNVLAEVFRVLNRTDVRG